MDVDMEYLEPEFGSSGNMLSKGSGKGKRGGAGGNASKSHNAVEAFQANKKRQAKYDREDAKEEAAARMKYMAEQDAKYAPVDKKDLKRMTRLQT